MRVRVWFILKVTCFIYPNTDTKIEQEFDKLDSYTVHVSSQFFTTRKQGTTISPLDIHDFDNLEQYFVSIYQQVKNY